VFNLKICKKLFLQIYHEQNKVNIHNCLHTIFFLLLYQTLSQAVAKSQTMTAQQVVKDENGEEVK
jgi:hypothetical protein